MAIPGWGDGECPFCGNEKADIVHPVFNEKFDQPAVICACQKTDEMKCCPTRKIPEDRFWDARLPV